MQIYITPWNRVNKLLLCGSHHAIQSSLSMFREIGCPQHFALFRSCLLSLTSSLTSSRSRPREFPYTLLVSSLLINGKFSAWNEYSPRARYWARKIYNLRQLLLIDFEHHIEILLDFTKIFVHHLCDRLWISNHHNTDYAGELFPSFLERTAIHVWKKRSLDTLPSLDPPNPLDTPPYLRHSSQISTCSYLLSSPN